MPAEQKSLMTEGKANTHLTHLEELVLTQGPEGYQLARAFLLELLETLKGNSKSKVQTSVKWDGAPAIFAGINPENGKFFVGTKSIFNKVPKINYTKEDVDKNHGHAPGLVDKLKKALHYLPSLGINNILQGDFMFDDEMLEVTDIEGEPHYRFKPNTIVYAVPVDSKLGEEIGKSKFGIVFHTTYESLDSGASYGADVSTLNRPPGVWFDDAFFTDDTGYVTLTENEESHVKSLVKEADSVNKRIDYNDLPFDLLNIYINSEIKSGQFLKDPKESYQGFLNWYQSRLEKRIDSLKSEKGRMNAFAKGEEQLGLFESKKEDIINLFKVSRLLFEAKNVFISKYNNAVYSTKHFVDDGSGDLRVTNPEGYVAVDHRGNGIKFVDRLEFSRANFAMDKGFAKDVNEAQIFEVFWEANGYSTKMSLQEWANSLPRTTKFNKEIFKKLSAGIPITSLVPDKNMVKQSLAEAVNWAINEQTQKKVIAIYPGRFQPMGRHHFQTYQQVATENGIDATFVATSDKTGPKSPLNFEQKKSIMKLHGVPRSQIVKVKNPYYAKEISELFSPDEVEMVYFVGAKDMSTNPRFEKTSGTTKEGYDWKVKVAPHVGLEIPGLGEMSGTTLRKALKDSTPQEFEQIMGWFDEDVYQLLQGILEEMSSMAGGNVQGGMIGTGSKKGPWHGLDVKAFNKRQAKDARLRGAKEFIGEEGLVNEVVDYLLGITVG